MEKNFLFLYGAKTRSLAVISELNKMTIVFVSNLHLVAVFNIESDAGIVINLKTGNAVEIEKVGDISALIDEQSLLSEKISALEIIVDKVHECTSEIGGETNGVAAHNGNMTLSKQFPWGVLDLITTNLPKPIGDSIANLL